MSEQVEILNKQLLLRTVELTQKLEAVRLAKTSNECPICLAGQDCEPHKIISKLSTKSLNHSVVQLEQKLKLVENERDAAIKKMSVVSDELQSLRESLPSMLLEAKASVSDEIDALINQNEENEEYIKRLAKRLRVHPDSTIQLTRSMLEDAVRKLVR